MKENISISGLAGAGKSTIGELLAKKTGYEFISIGKYTRKYALKKFKMDINQFQDYCNIHPEEDEHLDTAFSNKINSKRNLIIDYRLAYFFTKNCFNVYLDVSEDEAVRRLSNSKRYAEFDNFDLENVKLIMNSRNEKMRNRFLLKYNTDFTLKSNFDLVINTDSIKDIEEITSIIMKNFSKTI
jgi:radical S-adenosyl methionine domain-containing protein 2